MEARQRKTKLMLFTFFICRLFENEVKVKSALVLRDLVYLQVLQQVSITMFYQSLQTSEPSHKGTPKLTASVNSLIPFPIIMQHNSYPKCHAK